MRCRKDKACSRRKPILLESLLTILGDNSFACTIGLAWTEFVDPNAVNQGYTWRMVYDMLHLIRDVGLASKFPIAIMVRAPLARRSIPQLKWLAEVSGAYLVLEATAKDANLTYLVADIAEFYRMLPRQHTLLRVPQSLRHKLHAKMSSFVLPEDWTYYQEKIAYRDRDWEVVNAAVDSGHFLRGSQVVAMFPGGSHPVYLASKAEYRLRPKSLTRVTGRVNFFEDPEVLKSGRFVAALKIFVNSQFEKLGDNSSTVLIASNGYVSVISHSTKRSLVVSDEKTKEKNLCYHFEIEAEPRGVDVTVSLPRDCDFVQKQKVKELVQVRLDVTLNLLPFHVYLEPVGKADPVFIDQLQVT